MSERRELPPGWKWVKLGEVCEINPPRGALRREDGAPTTFVPMPAVSERTGTIASAQTRPYAEVKRGYTFFGEGDVLFAKITPCMQNGKHAVARGLLDAIGFGSTEFHVIRPGPSITAEWVHLYVRQPDGLRAATAHFTGAVGQQRVPEEFLAGLEIPLPPLAEQRRIAAVLNEQMAAVERARAAAQAQLDAARALPAAYLRRAFPRPGEPLPDGWRWARLDEVSGLKRGPFGGSLRKDNFIAYGYKVYEQQHAIRNNFEIGRYFIDAAKFEQMSVFSVVPGDLIVSCSGTMGRAAVVPNEAAPGIINQALLRLRPVRGIVDATYLMLYLGTEWIQATYFSSTIGSAIKNVASVSTIRGMQVALPPLSLQKRVVAVLNEQMAAVERARAAAEAQLAQINALPAALLRRAFSGEL